MHSCPCSIPCCFPHALLGPGPARLLQDRFAPLLQQCSQLIAAGENTDKRVSEILAEADEFVDQVGVGGVGMGDGGGTWVAGVGWAGLVWSGLGCCLFAKSSTVVQTPQGQQSKLVQHVGTPMGSRFPCTLPQLAPIYDHVSPCFPPDYRIFGVVRSAAVHNPFTLADLQRLAPLARSALTSNLQRVLRM